MAQAPQTKTLRVIPIPSPVLTLWRVPEELATEVAPEYSEVVLDMVELEMAVETFEDPVETRDVEAEGPVGTDEATLDVDIMKLLLPLGAPDGDAVGTFVGYPDVGVVESPLPLGAER